MTIADLKVNYGIAQAWYDLGLSGDPPDRDGVVRCPWPERHRNGDAHPSFSISNSGRRFKCFGCAEGGDVVDFVCFVLGIDTASALQWIAKIAGVSTVSRRQKPWQSVTNRRSKHEGTNLDPTARPRERSILSKPASMPTDVKTFWYTGCEYLRRRSDILAKIDHWRAWPEGTSAQLLQDGLISAPIVKGRPGIAFPVQKPTENGWIQIGFHYRLKPRNGERQNWFYVPRGLPALPFVLGSGYSETARCVIVFEGQWDAVCFCAAAGWLKHDTSWPEEAVVFGTRGTSGWRSLLDYWPFSREANVLLFPDADEAGRTWRGEFCERLKPLCREIVVRTATGAAKDFTDVFRKEELSPMEICKLLAS